MRYILALFLINAGNAFADYEMNQSLKCVRYFSYYEKKYGLPRDTLHSIALQETGKAHSQHRMSITWPWAANINGKSFYFRSKHEAARAIRSALRKGQSADVGCMQINLSMHGQNFRSVDHALEPQHNVSYAAKLLATKFAKLRSWPKAIAHYHSATPKHGEKYSKSVFKIAANLEQNQKAIMKYYLGKGKQKKKSRF